jgi:hypothetical protein
MHELSIKILIIRALNFIKPRQIRFAGESYGPGLVESFGQFTFALCLSGYLK